MTTNETARDPRALIAAVRFEVDEAMAAIAHKHGLTKLALGHRTTYDSNGFRGTWEATFAGGKSREEADYELMRDMFKLPPLGTKFHSKNTEYEIVGLKGRSNKVLAKRTDSGKLYLFERDGLLRAINKIAVAA